MASDVFTLRWSPSSESRLIVLDWIMKFYRFSHEVTYQRILLSALINVQTTWSRLDSLVASCPDDPSGQGPCYFTIYVSTNLSLVLSKPKAFWLRSHDGCAAHRFQRLCWHSVLECGFGVNGFQFPCRAQRSDPTVSQRPAKWPLASIDIR